MVLDSSEELLGPEEDEREKLHVHFFSNTACWEMEQQERKWGSP